MELVWKHGQGNQRRTWQRTVWGTRAEGRHIGCGLHFPRNPEVFLDSDLQKLPFPGGWGRGQRHLFIKEQVYDLQPSATSGRFPSRKQLPIERALTSGRPGSCSWDLGQVTSLNLAS
jgi:hypothetical protein